MSPAVSEFERALSTAEPEQAAALVRAFQSGPGHASPLIEPVPGAPGELLVTFLWQDAEAERVLLFVNRITDERDLAASYLRQVPSTDLWHLTYRMRADWRASYCFLPQYGTRPVWLDSDDQVAIRAALDHGLPDPGNPEICRNRGGAVMSVVSLPQAPAQPWVARRESVPRGAVTERTAPDGRRVWVYSPPALSDTPAPAAAVVPAPSPSLILAQAGISSLVPGRSTTTTPVVLVLDGEVWTSSHDLAATMDNLIADGVVRPAHLVMLDSGGQEARWRELGGSGEAGDYLVEQLLPWARREYPIGDRREDVVLAGLSLGGLTVLRTALQHPRQVGGVVSQSASLWRDDLSGPLAQAEVHGLHAYVEVGSQEWVLAGHNRAFATRLAAAGAAVRFVEYNGGHDYACWRGGIADGLRHLLPPE